MTAAEPVRHGTAETLARVLHFRQLTDTLPEAHELDPVIRFLLGRVTNPTELLDHLRDDLDQLWALATDDYDDDQLDESTDTDWEQHSFPTWQQEMEYRYSITADRLVHDVENHIRVARARHAQQPTTARKGTAA